MKYEQVYADVLLYCKQSPPPKPWSRFADGEKIWRAPLSGQQMLDALRECEPAVVGVRAAWEPRGKKRSDNTGSPEKLRLIISQFETSID